MKRGLVTYVLILLNVCLWAGERDSGQPRVSFGVEWTYDATIFSAHHFNYFAPDGFRVDDHKAGMSYHTDGEVNMHVGYNFDKYWNLSCHVGYSGAGNYRPVIPMSFRLTRFWGKSSMSDGWLSYADLGTGITLKRNPQAIATGKIGGGYRLSLSRFTKLDFIMAIKMIYTHPDVLFYGHQIASEYINSNEAYVGSLDLGISITF